MSADTRITDRRESRPRTGDAGTLPAELFERSDAKGLARLAFHAGLLGCTGFLLAASLPSAWSLPVILLHGVVLTFLFSPLHECIHGTAFSSRWLNDGVAFVCGAVLLLPREYFRDFHLQHHRFTQDPKLDPELAVGKPGATSEYLRHLSGLPYWCDRVTRLLRHARGKVIEPFIAEKRRAIIVREARLHLVLYAVLTVGSLAVQSSVLMVYWLAPVLLGQPFLRAFLLAEHTGCPMIPDMLVNSRTTHTNLLVKMLTWNMPYHAEHHAWAAVPFYNLPRVHERVRQRIAHTAPGYIDVHRNLWNRLDPA